MKGKLHCPHAKEYCVEYQTSLGTLKGIENTWTEVEKGGKCCEWENQQHGRGHHLKIALSNTVEDSQINLTLVHEDGSKAPAFTTTKHGKKKSTMLIGVDPRDWRLGLSWTHVMQEGPRKWHPAADCVIQVTSAGSSPRCVKENSKGLMTLYVPQGKPIIIPIRVEVLSAVKGAGDFSRYSVQCDARTNKKKTSKKSSSKDVLSSWTSPPILVEAKWLPAAPVREQNKRRFQKNSYSSSSNDIKVEGNGLSALMLEGGSFRNVNQLGVLEDAANFIRRASDSLNVLQNPRHGNMPGGNLLEDPAKLDIYIQNLQLAIAEYQSNRLHRSVLAHQFNNRKNHPAQLSYPKFGNLKQQMMNTAERVQTISQRNNEKLKQKATNTKNNRTFDSSILSSPPRDTKPSQMMPQPPLLNLNNCAGEMNANNYIQGMTLAAHLAVAAAAKQQHNPQQALAPANNVKSTNTGIKSETNLQRCVTEQSNPFDLLATAASKKHSVTSNCKTKRQRVK